MNKKKCICHLGPGEQSPGGMLSVIKSFLKNPFLKEYEQIHIATVSPTRKITTFLYFSLKLLYLLITKKVSLVYIHMSEGGSCYRTMVFINLCKLFSTPVVVHSHGSEIEVWYSNINKFLKTKFNNAMNKANAIVVLTPGWVCFWKQIVRNTKKIHVIPNYVYHRDYQTRTYLSNGYLNILFLGYIGERKGTYDLIKATKILVDSGIPVKIHIGGNGEIEKCNQLIEKLHLIEYANVYGWINKEKKEKLLNICDILVLPSKYESFGIVLLEAMNHQLPVICGSNGYSKEIIEDGHTGVVAPSEDAEKLAEILKNMYDEERLKNMGDKGYKHVEQNYIEEVVSCSIRNLLELLIN